MAVRKFKPIQLTEQDALLFWTNVDIKSIGECWSWKGRLDADGYGTFYRPKSKDYGPAELKAHRVAYFLHYGQDPKEMQVCHKCDNPPCCNPHCYFLGTNQDNHADKIAKGRVPKGELHWMRNKPELIQRGTGHHHATFTEEDVHAICIRLQKGEAQRLIAADYGVCTQAINSIKTGRTWAHISAPYRDKFKDANALHSIRHRGAKHPNAILTDAIVIEIRQMLATGVTNREVERKFSISPSTVSGIKKGTSWKHLL